jgi:uncharacterized caspase-like protein
MKKSVFLWLCTLSFFIAEAKNSNLIPQVYALVIGISNYSDDNIPDLKFASKDAISFSEYLRTPAAGSMSSQNLRVLVDENATRSNIFKYLSQLVARATEEDLFIFYFSGHGKSGMIDNTAYLLTYDTENENESGTAASMEEIKNLIIRSKAKMKVAYVDACHAGMFKSYSKGTSNDNSEIVNAFLKGLANASGGTAFFLSSSSRQQSLEDDKTGHGVFTFHLLQGLTGG